MRIKRFTAPDMRTALRMIRDEQGPDAVILSNRTTEDGIEVVAATDYDEALVAQAMHAAAPALQIPAAATVIDMAGHHHRPASGPVTSSKAGSSIGAHISVLAPPRLPVATTSGNATAEPAPAAVRESLVSRARAVFKIGDGPTAVELKAATQAAQTRHAATLVDTTRIPSPTLAVVACAQACANDAAAPAPTRLEAMMAALGANAGPVIAPAPTTLSATASRPGDWSTVDADYHLALSSVAMPVAPRDDDIVPDALVASAANHAPALHIVATPEPDPSIIAMRDDLANMRQLMERQMEQLSLERLRGSPARAAAYEALLGYGCEDALAQAVAATIDPRLEPENIQAPMLAGLARMITVARTEPLDEGGVIALVGPTGAGKTTTAAKLAARFAARHRARDVALVTTDSARPGAREQLHAHGRRLGITVCEAAGPEGLQDALAQLADYPLVLVDTTGYAPRDRALFGQILWLRTARKVRSLLVLPANAHPHDLGQVIRRYGPAAPEAVVLTKLDETERLGSALSVAVRHGLTFAYTTQGQQVPSDIDAANAMDMVLTLEKSGGAADNPLATEERHALV